MEQQWLAEQSAGRRGRLQCGKQHGPFRGRCRHHPQTESESESPNASGSERDCLPSLISQRSPTRTLEDPLDVQLEKLRKKLLRSRLGPIQQLRRQRHMQVIRAQKLATRLHMAIKVESDAEEDNALAATDLEERALAGLANLDEITSETKRPKGGYRHPRGNGSEHL